MKLDSLEILLYRIVSVIGLVGIVGVIITYFIEGVKLDATIIFLVVICLINLLISFKILKAEDKKINII